MTILLIEPNWYSHFIEKTEKITISEVALKELYSKTKNQKLSFKKEKNKAVIPILGPLTKTKNFFFAIFADHNTTYDEIISAIKQNEEDSSIETIELLINTPGGEWIGLTDTMNTIAAAKKPIVAIIIGQATSAGYGLASQADRIVSSNDSNEIGSIGVVTRAFNHQGKIKTIRSSHAGNKNPDAFSKEGEKEILRELNDVETKFIHLIAEGRTAATNKNITRDKIYKNYGQGSVFMAEEALKRGMIDEIIEGPERISHASDSILIQTDSSFQLTVTPFDSAAEIIERPWDKTAADKRIRQHTNSQDGPDNSGAKDKQYRSYFSWYDQENAENFAAYKLPVADVINAKKVINVRAVRNALARLPQTIGIPANEKERIQSTLQRYLDKFNQQQQREARVMDKLQMKDEFPSVYAEILEEGKMLERDRVIGHITMGKNTNAIEFSLKCITEGKNLTDQKILAEYLSTGVKQKDLDNREKDNPDAFSTDDDQNLSEDEKEKQLLDKVLKKSKQPVNQQV